MEAPGRSAGAAAAGTPSSPSYRRILLNSLTPQDRLDVTERRRIHALIRERLQRFCAENPALSLDEEIRALDREFALLEADPQGYGVTAEPRPATMAIRGVRFLAAVAPRLQAALRGRQSTVAAVLAGLALLLALESRGCGWFVSRCFDSGWFAADTSRSRDLKIAHNLGVTPGRLQVWFSPTADGGLAYATEFGWLSPASGNPVNVSADSENVFIAITGGIPLRNVYSGDTTIWTEHRRGYLRVRIDR